jgi:hypothetical protein
MSENGQVDRLHAAVDSVVAPWTKAIMGMVEAGLFVDLDACDIAYSAAIDDVLRLFDDPRRRTREEWIKEIDALKEKRRQLG